jgi:hypothetical protein
MAAGAAVGALTGGLAGEGVGEVVNPTARDHLSHHHLATGAGAGAGAATGAAVGSVAGPVGMAAGAAIGALAGGMAGKGAGEVVNPKAGDELNEHHLGRAWCERRCRRVPRTTGRPTCWNSCARVTVRPLADSQEGTGEVVNPKPGDELRDHHLGTGGCSSGVARAAVGAVGGPVE